MLGVVSSNIRGLQLTEKKYLMFICDILKKLIEHRYKARD